MTLRAMILAAGLALLAQAPALALGERYGALAFSDETMAYGVVYDSPAVARAEHEALSRCGANDCKVASRLSNTCLAIAFSAENHRTWREHSNIRQAEALAYETCAIRSRYCRIVSSGCTFDTRR